VKSVVKFWLRLSALGLLRLFAANPQSPSVSNHAIFIIPAPQQWPFLRILDPKAFGVDSLFAASQFKCLSMNYLRAKPGFSGQPQSSPVKVNQGIFLTRILPMIGQNTTFCILHSAFCI
jgi:hypothetical protein